MIIAPVEVGKCECGASYYHVEDIGSPCGVQYCRGTVKRVPDLTEAEEWLKANNYRAMHISELTAEGYGKASELRWNFVAKFGFAVLTRKIVEVMRDYAPLLEVGCGCGYWAYELRKAGVDIVATDPGSGAYGLYKPITWNSGWVDVKRFEGLKAIEKYPNRNLLIVWPDLDDWPFQVLKAFKGDYVLYVGEWRGCTASTSFHDALECGFQLVGEFEIPQFVSIYDYLSVWKNLKMT